MNDRCQIIPGTNTLSLMNLISSPDNIPATSAGIPSLSSDITGSFKTSDFP